MSRNWSLCANKHKEGQDREGTRNICSLRGDKTISHVVKTGQKSSLTILIKELNDIQSAASGPDTAGSGSCTEWSCNMVGGSGEGEAGRGARSLRGAAAGSTSGRLSVLQHRLVALEHTLGNFWSSALQRHLRGSTDEQDERYFTSTLVRQHAGKSSDRQINAEDARCGTWFTKEIIHYTSENTSQLVLVWWSKNRTSCKNQRWK